MIGRNRITYSSFDTPMPIGGARMCLQKNTGTTATHERLVCDKCGSKKSVPRVKSPPKYDSATCPHAMLTWQGSTKTTVSYYYLECRTTVNEVTRAQAEAADRLATQILLTSARIKEST